MIRLLPILLLGAALCAGCDISNQHVFTSYQGTLRQGEWSIEPVDPWLDGRIVPGEAHADTCSFHLIVVRRAGKGLEEATAADEVVGFGGVAIALSAVRVRLTAVTVEVLGRGRVAAWDTIAVGQGTPRDNPAVAWTYRAKTPVIPLPEDTAEVDLSAVVEWCDAAGEVLLRRSVTVRWLHVHDRYPEIWSR